MTIVIERAWAVQLPVMAFGEVPHSALALARMSYMGS